MKFTGLAFGLLSCFSFLSLVPGLTDSASAQCVQADISVQYNISGSREPTQRSNDVVMDSDGSCRGNVSVTTGVQGNVGGNGRVVQERQVRHRHQGDSSNHNGINTPTLQKKVNVGIDVYNPADNFNY